MTIMTYAKFHFNQLMLTFIFGIRAWRTTEKAGPDRVKPLPLETKRFADLQVPFELCGFELLRYS